MLILMKRILTCSLSLLSLIPGVTASRPVTVTVSDIACGTVSRPTVELAASDILSRLGSPHCYVVDAAGKEIPSQVTHDGKLLFQIYSSDPGEARYSIHPSDTAHTYPSLVGGRAYPERSDDFAWENELNGYRAYGPDTQRKGERAFGYDIFFKHKTDSLIVGQLYASQTSRDNWRKTDSLRRISRKLADDFQNSFTYHVDHGKGMDCFAVGATLGAGTAAILLGDHSGGTSGYDIRFPWCYRDVEILDNGPIRFTFRLDFAPVAVGDDPAVAEHRLISLDAGSYLNHTRVWYDGLSHPVKVAMGFPVRDDAAPVAGLRTVAVSDPTQGPRNGRALLGIISSKNFEFQLEKDNHIMGVVTLEPGGAVDYLWGFAWDKEDIGSKENWAGMLRRQSQASPLTIKIK